MANPARTSSLRRTILLVLLIVIPLTIFIFFYLNELKFPLDAQDDLAQYLAYQPAHPSPPQVETMLRAKTPLNFSEEMSLISYADSVYFRTTNGYESDTSGLKPLPYPPDDIWCIKTTYAEIPFRIVVLALHSDLYNADWIVHDIGASVRVLEQIGCESLLEP